LTNSIKLKTANPVGEGNVNCVGDFAVKVITKKMGLKDERSRKESSRRISDTIVK
jgi:hypothetical protein